MIGGLLGLVTTCILDAKGHTLSKLAKRLPERYHTILAKNYGRAAYNK